MAASLICGSEPEFDAPQAGEGFNSSAFPATSAGPSAGWSGRLCFWSSLRKRAPASRSGSESGPLAKDSKLPLNILIRLESGALLRLSKGTRKCVHRLCQPVCVQHSLLPLRSRLSWDKGCGPSLRRPSVLAFPAERSSPCKASQTLMTTRRWRAKPRMAPQPHLPRTQ